MSKYFKTKPYEHQRIIFNRTKDKKFYALLWEQGTGKTKAVIDTASWLYLNNKITGFLIIAPNGVHRNWIEQEVVKHLTDKITPYCLTWEQNYKSKKFKSKLKTIFNLPEDKLAVFSIGFDSAKTKNGYTCIEIFLKCHKSLLVLDESNRIKNHKATRTKKMLLLSRSFRNRTYRRILSGTPITKDLLNLYTQFNFLHTSILGFSSYYQFKGRYAEVVQKTMKRAGKEWTFKDVIGYKNKDELIRKIKPFSSRVLKDECLDLPQKVFTTGTVELSTEQQKAYDEMEEKLLIELVNLDLNLDTVLDNMLDDMVVAPIVLTKILRLREICSGFMSIEMFDKPKKRKSLYFKHNPKLDYLKEELEQVIETAPKILIWANFVPEIQLLEKDLTKIYGKDLVRCIYGNIPEKKRAYIRKEFQDIDPKSKKHKDKQSKVKILIANPAVAGIGFDLNKAHYIYYFSNTFNADHRWQSEDRVHRSGLDHVAVYKDIVCFKTVEEDVSENLQVKKQRSNEILDNLKL